MSKEQLHPEIELSDYEKLEKFALTIENTYCPETIKDELIKSVYDLVLLDLKIIVKGIHLKLNVISQIRNLNNL